MTDDTLQTSKRAYAGLTDYAQQQGAPKSAFVQAAYVETTRRGRPALKYPTETGPRWRFTDGLEPRHDSPKGYVGCWYGLKRAAALSVNKRLLVMVNGAAGVVVAQHFGIPAFAVSDGESRKLSNELLDELKTHQNREIIIALDCDATGQDRAAKRARQLIDAGFIVRVVNLQLGENGDIADFCKVHGVGAFEKLHTLPEIPPAPPKKQYQPRQAGETLLSTDERARRIAARRLDNYLSNIARASSGRRDLLLKYGTKIGGLVKGNYITYTEAESGLMSAAASCGLIEKMGEKEVERHIRGSLEKATATVITLSAHQPKNGSRKSTSTKTNRESVELGTPAQLAPFTADRTFSSRYVNQGPANVLNADCIALKSPTGSGKSKWAADTTSNAPSLLTIAYRTALVKSQADQYGALVYDALSGADRDLVASSDRISTTIDSLPRVVLDNRSFHTLVIDEWVSLIGHFSSAGTLKGKAAFTWNLLKRLITSAHRIIVMDAHLTDDALAELKALRGDLVCIENQYLEPKVPTQLLPNRLAFFSTALARIKVASAPVLLGVTSPAEARLTKDLITSCYPDKRIRVVTVKQSHLLEMQAFIRSINTRLSEVDVLIFNGAMSTGVDIQAEVDSIICLISRPLSPSDGVQMLGRARKTAARFAWVPDSIEGLDNDAADMFQSLELATTLTGVEASKPVRSLARVHSRHEARRNAEVANFLAVFRAYNHADGSATQAVVVRFDKAIAEKLKTIREGHTAQKRADTLDIDQVETITPEMLDTIRMIGAQEITPEIDAGYLRYKIETSTGQPINEALYDKYHTREARAALYRVDNSTSDNVSEIDHQENAEDLPLHQRTNATAIKELFSDGLNTLGAKGLDGLPIKLHNVTTEAFKGFGEWASLNSKRFKALLGYRGDHDGNLSDDTKAVRFFLKRFGVTLNKKQVMRDGKRFMLYSVDRQAIDELNMILAARRAKAAETGEQGITTKRQYKTILPNHSNPRVCTKTAQKGSNSLLSVNLFSQRKPMEQRVYTPRAQ